MIILTVVVIFALILCVVGLLVSFGMWCNDEMETPYYIAWAILLVVLVSWFSLAANQPWAVDYEEYMPVSALSGTTPGRAIQTAVDFDGNLLHVGKLTGCTVDSTAWALRKQVYKTSYYWLGFDKKITYDLVERTEDVETNIRNRRRVSK